MPSSFRRFGASNGIGPVRIGLASRRSGAIDESPWTYRQTNKHDPANVNFDRYRSKSSFKERTTSILLHYDFGLGENGFK